MSLIVTLCPSPNLRDPSLLLALHRLLQLLPQAGSASFIAMLPNIVTLYNT